MRILVLNPGGDKGQNVVRDLLYGAFCRGKRIGGTQMPPLNLLYVATVLKENNHQVELVDAAVDYASYEKFKKRARNFQAVIILSSSLSFSSDLESLRELKKLNPEIKTIIFGSHPTFMPNYCLGAEVVDYVVRREPEFVIRDLVESLDKKKNWKKIKGIGYRINGKIVINEFYPFIKNLDDLPIPDRSLLPKKVVYFNPVVKRMPYANILTSRGCPGKCNFCTAPSFYGHRFRIQSAERVIKELKVITTQGYKEIFFRDETLGVFPERQEKICLGIIKEGLDFTWVCNSRVDVITLEMMRLMKKAGCHMIKFGVESGVQRILNNINKGTTLAQAKRAFRWAKEMGIDTHAHIMLGCPGEDQKTIKTTVEFVKSLNPTTVTFGIQTPYPGTELFEKVAATHPEIKDGTECSLSKIHTTAFYNQYFTKLTTRELEKSIRWAYQKFYFRLAYLFQWLKRLKSWDELLRVVRAGVMIFDFSLRGDE